MAVNPRVKRLQIDVPTTVAERIERLKNVSEVKSQAAVVIKALKVYESLLEASEVNAEIIIRDVNGKETTIRFL